MPLNQQGTDENESLKKDEDANFEQENELTMSALPDESEAPKQSMIEGTLPAKEDTLGNSDFPPLTEQDKQPKLQDEERIKELNRKTSLGD